MFKMQHDRRERKSPSDGTSPDHTVWLCGGSGNLSPESKAELAQFAGYLRFGGKRVFGSYAGYLRACEIKASQEQGTQTE